MAYNASLCNLSAPSPGFSSLSAIDPIDSSVLSEPFAGSHSSIRRISTQYRIVDISARSPTGAGVRTVTTLGLGADLSKSDLSLVKVPEMSVKDAYEVVTGSSTSKDEENEHQSFISHMKGSPTGGIWFVTDDRYLFKHDILKRSPLGNIRLNREKINRVTASATSLDGKYIAIATAHGRIQVFNNLNKEKNEPIYKLNLRMDERSSPHVFKITHLAHIGDLDWLAIGCRGEIYRFRIGENLLLESTFIKKLVESLEVFTLLDSVSEDNISFYCSGLTVSKNKALIAFNISNQEHTVQTETSKFSIPVPVAKVRPMVGQIDLAHIRLSKIKLLKNHERPKDHNVKVSSLKVVSVAAFGDISMAAYTDGTINMWDSSDSPLYGAITKSFVVAPTERRIQSVSFLSKHLIVASISLPSELSIWDWSRRTNVIKLPSMGLNHQITCMSVVPERYLAIGLNSKLDSEDSYNYKVLVWDVPRLLKLCPEPEERKENEELKVCLGRDEPARPL